MININLAVGGSAGIPILDTTGQTTFPTLMLLADTSTVTPSTIVNLGTTGLTTPVEISVGSGIYSTTFSATATGNFYVSYKGVVMAHIQVIARDLLSVLTNVEDEALGSWSWDKVGGVLTLVRNTGTTMATYSVVDTVTSSSRSRLT